MKQPDSTWKPAPPTPEERVRAERFLARIIRDDERSGLNIDHTYWYGEPDPNHLTLPEMVVVDELHAVARRTLSEYVLFMRTRHHFWGRHATLCALAKGYWVGRKKGEQVERIRHWAVFDLTLESLRKRGAVRDLPADELMLVEGAQMPYEPGRERTATQAAVAHMNEAEARRQRDF